MSTPKDRDTSYGQMIHTHWADFFLMCIAGSLVFGVMIILLLNHLESAPPILVSGDMAPDVREAIAAARESLDNKIAARNGYLIALFGALITLVVIFFALRVERSAVSAAMKMAQAELEAEQAKLKQEAQQYLDDIKYLKEQIEEDADEIEDQLHRLQGRKTSETDKARLKRIRERYEIRPIEKLTIKQFQGLINALIEDKDYLTAHTKVVLFRSHWAESGCDHFRLAAINAKAQILWFENRHEEALELLTPLLKENLAKLKPPARVELAFNLNILALFNSNIRGREEHAVRVVDTMIRMFEGEIEAKIKRDLASAMGSKALYLSKIPGRIEDAVQAADTMIERFGGEEDEAIKRSVALTMSFKVELCRLSNRPPSEAQDAFDALMERFWHPGDPEIQLFITGAKNTLDTIKNPPGGGNDDTDAAGGTSDT